jgi:hypothetical protein
MRLNEDLVAIRDSVRRMVQKHVVPLVEGMEESDRFPSELVPVFGTWGCCNCGCRRNTADRAAT